MPVEISVPSVKVFLLAIVLAALSVVNAVTNKSLSPEQNYRRRRFL